MASQTVSDSIHRTKLYLREHPLLRWFVVPLLFMAGVVVGLAILLGVGSFGTVQLVTGFLVLSVVSIVVGLAVEQAVLAVLR